MPTSDFLHVQCKMEHASSAVQLLVTGVPHKASSIET